MTKVLVIVSRTRPQLYAQIRRDSLRNPSSQVIFDRRRGPRRTATGAAAFERRKGERRARPEINEQIHMQGWAAVVLN